MGSLTSDTAASVQSYLGWPEDNWLVEVVEGRLAG